MRESGPGSGYYHSNDAVSYSFSTPCKNDVVRDLEQHQEEGDGDGDGDSEFEFAVPGIGEYSSPISADEIFQNGQIKPLFPVPNANSVYTDTNSRGNRSPEVEKSSNSKSAEISQIRLPLEKLMISERETKLTESVSSSSSETDDLEGVAPETYCVWTPNKNSIMRKKSQSTGPSKRWKFRDLLYRSHSEGGDALDFSTSKTKSDQKKAPAKKKATGESDRKTSYLGGWFANMNGLSRTVQPF